jgi:hypothetical protein
MTVPKPTEPTLTIVARAALPALPPKRARRRSTRASHSWCFRKPPSRKRVAITCARGVPDTIHVPVLAHDHYPLNDNCN